MRVSSKDGFVFRFDNSYDEKAEPFDFVKVWQISEYTLDPSREILEHIQFCHEITYVVSGKATFLSGDAKDDLQQGDIHLIAKGVSHKIIPQEEGLQDRQRGNARHEQGLRHEGFRQRFLLPARPFC